MMAVPSHAQAPHTGLLSDWRLWVHRHMPAPAYMQLSSLSIVLCLQSLRCHKRTLEGGCLHTEVLKAGLI